MRSIDIVRMALKSLLKRKARTFLTVLGVVIGTASIVIMVSLGIAMNESFDTQIKNMGDITKIEIYNPDMWNEASSDDSPLKLTRDSVAAFKKIEGVKSATPVSNAYLHVQCGKLYTDCSVIGIEPEAMEDMGYDVSQGRCLDTEDEDTMNVVFGSEILYSFYKKGQQEDFYKNGGRTEDPVDVMNESLKISYDYNFSSRNADKTIKPYKMKAVGIYGEEFGDGYNVIMPIGSVEKLNSEMEKQSAKEQGSSNANKKKIDRGFASAYVKCKDIDSVEDVAATLKEMGYEVYSAMDSVSGMKKIAGSLQLLLGAIGFVSLLVAAIGITNTMIMSIYERTKEIGIMKVIGARLKDIKRLFLLEAMLIGFIGGAIGVGVSRGISVLLNNVGISFISEMQSVEGGSVSVIPFWLCLGAMLFSSVIGLISGYLPARRAMKLSALNALRK